MINSMLHLSVFRYRENFDVEKRVLGEPRPFVQYLANRAACQRCADYRGAPFVLRDLMWCHTCDAWTDVVPPSCCVAYCAAAINLAGPDNPDTLITSSNINDVVIKLGRYAQHAFLHVLQPHLHCHGTSRSGTRGGG